MSVKTATMAKVGSAKLYVLNRWSARPSLDWIAAVLLVGGHAVLVVVWDVPRFLEGLPADDRLRVYSTLAPVSAILFGFATASVSFFYGSAKGERVDLLKSVLGPQVVRTWRAALGAPLVAVGVTLAALVFDTGKEVTVWVTWMVEFAVVMLALRTLRLRWLFASTLSLMSTDASESKNVRLPTAQVKVASAPASRAARQK